MPDLLFRIDRADPVRFSQTPLLALELTVSNEAVQEEIQSILLQYQVWIEPADRGYDEREQPLLLDLFGEPDRWNRTLRSLLWTRGHVLVPPFTGSRSVNLDVPCTYDFNVAVAKYFYALKDGTVPLRLMFSGTVFYAPEDSGEGGIRVAQIPLEKEASYRLSVRVWKALMEHYYPNSHWLCLSDVVFDQLYRYKLQNGLPTWEQVFGQLLPRDVKEGGS